MLEEFKMHAVPVRQLTQKELQLLAPFLTNNKITLSSGDVYLLEGEHEFRFRRRRKYGYTSIHTIRGVEVVFYDMHSDLSQHIKEGENQALIVCSQAGAVIIEINGQSIVDHALTSPTPEERSSIHTPEKSTSHASSFLTDAASTFATFLEQRLETDAETQDRLKWHFNKRPAIFFLLAILTFAIAAQGKFINASSFMMAACLGVFFAMTGLSSFLKKRKGKHHKKTVSRYQGKLNYQLIVTDDYDQGKTPILHIGENIPLKIPERWQNQLDLNSGDEVQIQVRDEDHTVVDLGKGWSIEEENKLMPSRKFVQYIPLAILGCFAFFLHSISSTESWKVSYNQVQQYFSMGVTHYERFEDLLAAPPEPNTFVIIEGVGSCHSQVATHRHSTPWECNTLRWGQAWGEQLPSALNVSSAFMALYDGSFLESRSFVQLSTPEQRKVYGVSTYIDQTILTNFPLTIQTIETACLEGLRKCEQIKNQLMESLTRDITHKKLTWETLLQQIQSKEIPTKILVSPGDFTDRIQTIAHDLVEDQLKNEIDEWLNKIHTIQQQKPYVLISFEYAQSFPRPPENTVNLYKDLRQLNTNSQAILEQVKNEQTLAFNLQGVIQSISHDDQILSLILKEQNNTVVALASMNRLLLFVFGLLLFGIGTLRLLIALFAQTNRYCMLGQHYQHLPSPRLEYSDPLADHTKDEC